MSDKVQVVLIALGWAGTVAVFGALSLRALRYRPLRQSLLVLSMTAVAAVIAATVASPASFNSTRTRYRSPNRNPFAISSSRPTTASLSHKKLKYSAEAASRSRCISSRKKSPSQSIVSIS